MRAPDNRRTASPGDTPRFARHRVMKGYQVLLRFIHARGLQVGDRLPAQDELRRQLGLTNYVLSAAMQEMVDAGMLTRQRRTGTVVTSLDGHGLERWTIGLMMPSAGTRQTVPFYPQLLHHLQTALSDFNCRPVTYCYSGGDGRQDRSRFLDRYPGLDADLRVGQLDALLSPLQIDLDAWNRTVRDGTPCCHVGAWEAAPCGVLIEQATMVRTAVRLLTARGCQRLAVVSHSRANPNHYHFWDGFMAGLAEHGQTALPAQNITSDDIHGIAGGQRAAGQILALPARQRPDGLIVTDDWLAMGLAATLSQFSDCRPRLVVQTNLQTPLAFALPVIRFDVDIHEMARKGVELLFDLLRNPQLADRMRWVCPRLASEEESEMAPVGAMLTRGAFTVSENEKAQPKERSTQ